jgi:hypothetical protein
MQQTRFAAAPDKPAAMAFEKSGARKSMLASSL